ncbi:MAG: hypothetical protein ACRC46_01280 [Thermoguttaceae bacterium]
MIQFHTFLILVASVIGAGCSHVKPFVRATASDHTSLDSVEFGRSAEAVGKVESASPMVSLRLDGVPLRQVVAQISEHTKALIVTPAEFDDKPVTGVFLDDPLDKVIMVLAGKLGLQHSYSDGVWIIGTLADGDSASLVVSLPPADVIAFELSLAKQYPSIRSSVVGSVLWCCGDYRTIRRISSDVELLRQSLTRAYVAEVFFVRISEKDFLEASVDLQVNAVDLFASSVKVEQLFKAVTRGDGAITSSAIESRPVVYLSEGRLSKMSVGSEIVRERRRTLENGATEVSDYDRFSDGLEMSLTLNRVSDGKYSVAFDLVISTFDGKSATQVPPRDQSSLNSPGLLCSDGLVVFGGMLRQKQDSKQWKFLGIDARRSSDVLTIWLRVREVRV